ncbi:MAG: hypothetical protein V5A57_03065, partial [Candidatus Paceibacterota bacterium]
MIKDKLKNIIREAIEDAGLEGLEEVSEIEIEPKPRVELGDFSSTVAFDLEDVIDKPSEEIS